MVICHVTLYYSIVNLYIPFFAVPSMPLTPALVVAGPTSLTASWTPPDPANGIITAYTVYCRTSQNQHYPEQVPSGDNPFTVRATTDGDATDAVINDLEAFTNYSCYVTANTTVGEGEESDTVSERTNEDGEF